MIRLASVVMGAQDVDRAVRFWSEALNYSPRTFPGSTNGFTLLTPPNGDGTRIALQQSDAAASATPAVHLDFVVDDAEQQASEVLRLVNLGAVRVDWDLYPEDPDFVVLADTEGNRFCVIDESHG